jgi:hypothetical protein
MLKLWGAFCDKKGFTRMVCLDGLDGPCCWGAAPVKLDCLASHSIFFSSIAVPALQNCFGQVICRRKE